MPKLSEIKGLRWPVKWPEKDFRDEAISHENDLLDGWNIALEHCDRPVKLDVEKVLEDFQNEFPESPYSWDAMKNWLSKALNASLGEILTEENEEVGGEADNI